MSSATPDETGRKRVRFTENDAEKHATIAPSNKAKEVFSTAVVSLLPAIRTLAEYFFQKFLKLQISFLQVSMKKEKMLMSATVPRSARSNFKLTTKEQESEARQQLNNNVQTCIEQYQTTLKENIIASLDLDLTTIKETIMSTTCDALYKLTNIYLILQFATEDIPADNIHPQVINIIRTDPRIVHYIFNGFDSFSMYYRTKNNITTPMETAEDDDGTDISVLANNAETTVTFNSRHFARNRAVISRASSTSTASSTTAPTVVRTEHALSADNNRIIQQLFYRMFNQSWAAYKHEHDLRITNALLSKYTTNTITTTITNDTAAVVNAEPSVDPKLLKDIISEEVKKATKTLKQQLNTLQQSNKRSKNFNGGDTNNKTTTNRAHKKKSTNSVGKSTKMTTKEKDTTNKQKQQKQQKQTKNNKNNSRPAPIPKKTQQGRAAKADANGRGSRNGKKDTGGKKTTRKNSLKKRTTRSS
jgi:hypothetical protein